jgi:hypothetical protein
VVICRSRTRAGILIAHVEVGWTPRIAQAGGSRAESAGGRIEDDPVGLGFVML